MLKSVSVYIISMCEGQNLDACVQYFYRREEDEGGKYLNEGSANVPGVAMAMHTPLERSPHPHHQPVPLVICSDQHIGHEDEEEGIESHKVVQRQDLEDTSFRVEAKGRYTRRKKSKLTTQNVLVIVFSSDISVL